MAGPAPSLDLFRRVRAEFIASGTTLTEWCRANQMHVSNARTCLTGAWDGPAARLLRTRICDAAGVTVGKRAA